MSKMRLVKITPILLQSRRQISALYMTGDKAKENYAVLTPFMEFTKTLIDGQDDLRRNIARRRLNFDLDLILKKYEAYRQGETKKHELETQREELSEEIKKLQSNSPHFNEKKSMGKILRNALKTLREELYPIEDDFIHEYLKVPNKLNKKTPNDEIAILYRQGLPDNSISSPTSHTDRKDLIDYRDTTCYYLKKEASHFDYHVPINCVSRFVENGFTQFVNPDFVRTLLLEAAFSDLNRFDLVHEEDNESKVNLLHLNGGGSMSSFLGFITKLAIFPSQLPLRLVASGRKYLLAESSEESANRGLYTAMQSTTVQTFIVAQNDNDLEQEIENTLGLIIDIFREFKIHFRIVYVPAFHLNPAESSRATIQMFSPYYNDYIDVGHLSNYSDFISKRLLFHYRDGKDYKFPCFAAGPIMNVSKVLACLLENQRELHVVATQKRHSKNAVENFKNLFSSSARY